MLTGHKLHTGLIGSETPNFRTIGPAWTKKYKGALTRPAASPLWIRTAATVVALLAIELFTASHQSIPFVCFQF